MSSSESRRFGKGREIKNGRNTADVDRGKIAGRDLIVDRGVKRRKKRCGDGDSIESDRIVRARRLRAKVAAAAATSGTDFRGVDVREAAQLLVRRVGPPRFRNVT